MTASPDTDLLVEPLPPETGAKLRRYNGVMAAIHAGQAVAILLLATAFALPVTGTFLQGPPGTPAAAPRVLFSSARRG